MSDAKTSWRVSPVRETHRLPKSISEMLGGALARTRGHGEHSLTPTSRMDRNGDRDTDWVKVHHAAEVHVLRPSRVVAHQVVNRVTHGVSSNSEPPRIAQ